MGSEMCIRDRWTRARLRDHPRVPITISIDTSAQTRYRTPNRTSNTLAEVSAIAGTTLAGAAGFFTQGCDNLVVITDHKPLVKIFGDRTLDEITNSRLFRLKQRTLPWRFDIKHLPGKTNHAADATSRHPSPSGSVHSTSLGASSTPDLESALMASIRQDTQDIGTISWSLLRRETASDPALSSLLKLTDQGTPSLARNNHSLTPLWPICESVYAQEGVFLYQDSVFVPLSLCSWVLQNLHAAHQGNSMIA